MINTFSLFAISQAVRGLVFSQGVTTLIYAGIGLTFASMVAKPVINILLLPINLITFNVFKWISSAVALYLVTLVVDGFEIVEFVFGGYSNLWIEIPEIALTGIAATIAFSIVLSLFSSIVYWIIS